MMRWKVRKNRHRCVVCGRILSKRVSRNVYKTRHSALYVYHDYFGTELEAHMQAATMKKLRHEKAQVVGDDGRDWKIRVLRNGGGWMGLNKVCSRKGLKCLKAFVKRAVLPE